MGRTDAVKSRERILLIAANCIRQSDAQSRKIFDENELVGLAQSIRENGLLQPLTVRRIDEGWQLIAGERRLRACKMLNIERIPCIEINTTYQNAKVLTLIENIQRSDLTYFEEAAAMQKLLEELCISQEQLAKRLGKSQSAIANKLRLLKLEDNIKNILIKAKLSERHARALLAAPEDERENVVKAIIKNNMTVEQTEQYIKLINNEAYDGNITKKRKKIIPIVRDVRLFINTINHAVDVMNRSGINAQTKRIDDDMFIEYVIRIPKQNNNENKISNKISNRKMSA